MRNDVESTSVRHFDVMCPLDISYFIWRFSKRKEYALSEWGPTIKENHYFLLKAAAPPPHPTPYPQPFERLHLPGKQTGNHKNCFLFVQMANRV